MARPAPLDLRDRVVLVTGGARGIGLDAARRAAGKGARVALLDVDGDEAARAAQAIGARARAWAVDVTDRDRLGAVVEEVAGAMGGIDVVLANAGVAPPTGTILSVDAGAWERVLEVNLGGVYRTVKATLPHVVARRGHVLVVASVYALANGALASPYAVSKAAVEALGRALRTELAPHGATAGVAYFGFIDTKLVRDAFDDRGPESLRDVLPGFIADPLPVGRAGAAIVRGLERRSARVMVPRYVPVLQVLRGLLPFTLDRRMAGDERLWTALRAAEADVPAAVPPAKLTQASPSR
jgi:NAD(P)-dependent dehydrogenase (short-subunit alcohol dehydrogenase family)